MTWYLFCSYNFISINSQNHVNRNKIGLMSKVSANGLRDQGSIPGWFILKLKNIEIDASLLCTQYYNVRINDK